MINYCFMKFIFCLIFLFSGFFSNSNYNSNDNEGLTRNVANAKDLKLYTISGTFTLGPFTYSYTIVVNATICVICNPPKITIHGVESLTICLQGTQTCGSWGVTRIVHDSQDNLEFIEFWLRNIQNAEDVENYLNDEEFQQEIKDQLFNQH